MYNALNIDFDTNMIYKRLYDFKNYNTAIHSKLFKPYFSFTKTKHFRAWIKQQDYIENNFKNNCILYFKTYILPKLDISNIY